MKKCQLGSHEVGVHAPTVISIVAGLLAVIAGGIISYFQADKTLAGRIIVGGTITLLGFAVVVQLFARLQQTIEDSLSRRLPQFAFLTGADEIVEELRATVRNARRYVYVTGSAGRDSTYLDAIEEKLTNPGVRHIRVLYYRHVSKPLQKQLLRIFNNDKVQVLYADEAHHGYFVLTESTAILLIPNRNFQDSVAIKFSGSEHREVFLEAFTRLSALSDPIKTSQQLEKLFDDLKGIGH